MFDKACEQFGIILAVLFFILAIAAILGVSFLFFTLGYWLITLILANFFAFILPFSWSYSFGAWLIWLIVIIFFFPGLKIASSNNNKN